MFEKQAGMELQREEWREEVVECKRKALEVKPESTLLHFGFVKLSCQEAEHKRRRELKERELSAKRKRENQEKKREDQERKRVQEKSKEETPRRGMRVKASTAERVKF